MNRFILREGLRMFMRHLRVRGKHFTRLGTSATPICETILSRLYTKGYYHTSLGHYPHFYSRDFGMMVPSLLQLGKREEVISTLTYALQKYEEHGAITTFINKYGRCVNFPDVYSPDSTAYLLLSVRLANDKALIKKYAPFLASEVRRFFDVVIDAQTGQVKRKTHFGGMRDHSKRDSSCYDTVMAAIVQREATLLGLENPLAKYNYSKILLDMYWQGNYFVDDQVNRTLSGDANIYPFWHGIITDKHLLNKAIASMYEQGLCDPFPIKYVADTNHTTKVIAPELLVPGWQDHSLWPMSALPFIEVVSKVDAKQAKIYCTQYKKLIEKYGTFIEVYGKDGTPYKSAVFSADEGMIWCALWLVLAKKLKV